MRLVAILALLLWGTTSFAEDEVRTMVHARIDPHRPVVVGQPVRLVVDVLVTTWFTQAPEFPPLEIAGALTVLPDEQAQHMTLQIDGVTWFGLSRSYIITPMEPRAYTVPRIQIVLHPGLAFHPIRVWTPARKLLAEVPPGAKDMAVFFAATGLHVAQRFDRKLEGLRVGDTFSRTVTLQADGTPAMFLPPTTFREVAGLMIYPNQPEVENISHDRKGFIAGRRKDSATYLVQQPGDYELSEITVEWWDIRSRKLRRQILPPVQFTALRNLGYRPEIGLPREADEAQPAVDQGKDRRRWILWGSAVLAVMVVSRFVLPIVRKYWRILAAWRAERRQRYDASEPAAFQRLESAVLRGDDAETVQRLYQWLDRAEFSERPVLVEDAVAVARDAEFAKSTEALLVRCFGRRKPSAHEQISRDLAGSLHRVEKRVHDSDRKPIQDGRALAPLNPE